MNRSFASLRMTGEFIELLSLVAALVVLALAYVVFMKKYYHLHEEYLKSLEK